MNRFMYWMVGILIILLIGGLVWWSSSQSANPYHKEQKENERLAEFFSEFNRVYGYLYTAEDSSFQLLIKIEEALREGEVSGSLLMVKATGDVNSPIEVSRYNLNGITDGLMIKFYTTADGQQMKLEGNFDGDARSFILSFWESDKKLLFQAVTENEYQKRYEEFKTAE